jgi:predicted PolB exonuclease-like 3'-5' exonuclease
MIDIETVPQCEQYDDLSDRWKKLWDHKAAQLAKNGETPDEIYSRAGIYAEFGKIVCISAGVVVPNGDGYTFRVKSYYGHDEKELLASFGDMLQVSFSGNGKFLCGHNAREFDFPYLCRRMLINGLKIPQILDLSGKKPWEINHFDTMDLWKFGDFKSYTSLDLLAAVFDVPTPKDVMDGSQVYPVYYKEKDIEKIKTYCEKDILTLANIVMRFKGLPIIEN